MNIGSIIIPAHNEAASIARCLSSILRDAQRGEFEIIVACNGCTDDTARIARGFGPDVTVVELEEGNKVGAVNFANALASHFPRLYVDADLVVSTKSARALLSAVTAPNCLAAIGRMELDTSGASLAMRHYYEIWSRNAYLSAGKFGGVYALSREAVEMLGVLPRVINDDEYVRRQIPAGQVTFVPQCSFVARVPRTFTDLLKVRRRVHRGNRQLAQMGRKEARQSGSSLGLFSLALRQPRLWLGLAVYVAVNLMARREPAKGEFVWARDESSRRVAQS
jgi:glycosyltransferase involved in cell wall biosynthesis